ncbi:glycosyl-4,4'-diaponeurosporenoate acyltransferase CrtO family protein [Reichenbachiella ulvae]|uniref:Glycosyl-4,4'-diaponeurosporenoate acyltransferase n=1 Tax=Reichenbachiella ulvae TaxID=2980104 RepID=A0ABT3CN31_9BACT|nr:hypothetical protein [Reichenbachiella ulvae]MCV9385105.1 hypothetical protein [Reichenbachiella ulvae]
MTLNHLIFSISICFISWIVGLILNAIAMKLPQYQRLAHFNFVESKRLNRYMGIGVFKWIVKNTPFKFFNQKLKATAKLNLDQLNDLRKEMTTAEIGHLIGFVFVAGFAVYQLFLMHWVSTFSIMLANTLLNLYPSLLQQENKRRIDRLIKVVAR